MVWFIVLFIFGTAFAGKQPEKQTKKPSQPHKTKAVEEDKIKEDDFIPSLLDSLSDTHQLKNKIERQLAKELDTDLKERLKAQKKRNHGKEKSIANFGDFSVSISQRKKNEPLKKIKK